MSETTTTETTETPEPQMLGGASQEQITAYRDHARRITETYDAAVETLHTSARAIGSQLNEMYGQWDHRNDSVMGVVQSFNRPLIEEHRANRDKALDAARDQLVKDADALTAWLLTEGRDEYGGSYVDDILALLPATVAQLNEYANTHGLCTAYEDAAKRIHDSVEGGYFTDTRTVTKRLPYWAHVPEEFGGPKDGEDSSSWEVVAVVPAFYRDIWVQESSPEMLTRRAVSFTYRQRVTTPDSNED
jgi:hypothetical protein